MLFFEFSNTVMGPLNLPNLAVSPESLLRLVSKYQGPSHSHSQISQKSHSTSAFLHLLFIPQPTQCLHNYCFLFQIKKVTSPKKGTCS